MEVKTMGSPPGRDCPPSFPLQHAAHLMNILSSAPSMCLPFPLPAERSQELGPQGSCAQG